MFRLWAKTFKNNHMLNDMTVSNNTAGLTRTQKIFQAIDEICLEFDLGKPIWLSANVEDFKRHDKVRFRQDNFIEEVDFDYLAIHVIEED